MRFLYSLGHLLPQVLFSSFLALDCWSQAASPPSLCIMICVLLLIPNPPAVVVSTGNLFFPASHKSVTQGDLRLFFFFEVPLAGLLLVSSAERHVSPPADACSIRGGPVLIFIRDFFSSCLFQRAGLRLYPECNCYAAPPDRVPKCVSLPPPTF